MQDHYFEKVIELAKKTRQEEGKINPFVGAIAIDENGNIIDGAYRGEKEPGDHSEFTLLEKKLKDTTLAGCTLIVTLEPCTKRSKEKLPCAERIIERKIKRVFIGMLDPNPEILGQGVRKLKNAGIDVQFFPDKFANEVEELNREFIRSQQREKANVIPAAKISILEKRSLDDWYKTVNTIYWNRNYYKDPFYIFTHLAEVIGGLSLLASEKPKEGVKPESYVAKSIAWWMALCGKMGIKSVEEMLWKKFPKVCPYCQLSRHDQGECTQRKAAYSGVYWEQLNNIGKDKTKPTDLGDWQKMFAKIYPPQVKKYEWAFSRLTEELGELAESLRVFSSVPGYFLSEACDVFAWLMQIQNTTEFQLPLDKKGKMLNSLFAHSYPDFCMDCGKMVCACPPILPKTIGRIAHEVPKADYSSTDIFMTVERTSEIFSNLE